MALTNISTEHIQDLMLALNISDLESSQVRQSIQRNSNNYSKLKTLSRQMAFIKQEIEEIINDSMISLELDKVSCKFKKIPGQQYYLYQKINSRELYFSRLEPEIWDFEKNNIYRGTYLFDYDLTLQRLDT